MGAVFQCIVREELTNRDLDEGLVIFFWIMAATSQKVRE